MTLREHLCNAEEKTFYELSSYEYDFLRFFGAAKNYFLLKIVITWFYEIGVPQMCLTMFPQCLFAFFSFLEGKVFKIIAFSDI